MEKDVYERLAAALDRLPNGFPRTSSGVEIRILKKIFSPEEASIASQLNRSWEPLEALAKRIRLDVENAGEKMKMMYERGLLRYEKTGGRHFFRLAPFIIGIYEAQLETMDHELAHLVEDYLSNGGATGIMKPQPALHRVLPAQRAVKSEWILPYDDVKAILSSSKSFGLRDCICRVQQDKNGTRRCDFPLRTCLFFSSFENPPHRYTISKEEALSILDRSEKIGLVHTVSNVMKGLGYVCNCCGCCCGILRGVTDFGIENSVAYANYYSEIDPQACQGCGLCTKRCQVHAISEKDGLPVVNRKKCIGCGLCATGCPNGAARLIKKPDAQIVDPPLNFEEWEHRRLHNRGMVE